MDALIYLDHNATTPLLPEVIDAMHQSLRDHWGNPSSTHRYGRQARAALNAARQQVADLLGADVDEIVFTSGGTEANNLAIRGLDTDRRTVVSSAVEHPATARACEALVELGWTHRVLPVDAAGQVAVPELGEDVGLVTVMHANNEVGTVQPIGRLSAAAHAVGAFVHTDAAQSVGKVPVNVQALKVDLLSVAGHKLYGPKGVGALYVRRGTPIRPVIRGAGHENGLRPGTENIASIVGLGVACAVAQRDLATLESQLRTRRDLLHTLLHREIPDLALSGHPTDRLPNTLNVRFPGVPGSAVLAGAPEVAASTGSACHEGEDETPSAVLVAMGVSHPLGAVRLTLGRHTSESDVRAAAAALVRSWRAASPAFG